MIELESNNKINYLGFFEEDYRNVMNLNHYEYKFEINNH